MKTSGGRPAGQEAQGAGLPRNQYFKSGPSDFARSSSLLALGQVTFAHIGGEIEQMSQGLGGAGRSTSPYRRCVEYFHAI